MTRPAPRPGRPDATLVAFPGGPVPPPRRTRDPRIDTFRGLALVMIIVTHMPGNPYEAFTIREIGFSDAAEAFFLMSGIAAGIAYSPAVARWLDGETRLWDAVAPMWGRAWQLYLVQTLLTVTAIALYAWAAGAFYRAEFREMHGLALLYEETGPALVGLATLGYQIGYVNILPAYMVLLLFAPLIVAGALRAPRATLAVCACIWLVAGAMRFNIPNHPGLGGWFFSPFAWQLIFGLGLVIGVLHRRGHRLVAVSWPLFSLALAFLVFVLAWRHLPGLGAAMNHMMAELSSLGAPFNLVSHNKTHLAAPRLLHVLALLYVISCLPAVTRICAHRAVTPLRFLGRHGLLVFALGTVLALAGQILMDVEPDVAWLPWALPPLAIALVSAAAWAKERAAAPAPRKEPAAARTDRPKGPPAPPRESLGQPVA